MEDIVKKVVKINETELAIFLKTVDSEKIEIVRDVEKSVSFPVNTDKSSITYLMDGYIPGSYARVCAKCSNYFKGHKLSNKCESCSNYELETITKREEQLVEKGFVKNIELKQYVPPKKIRIFNIDFKEIFEYGDIEWDMLIEQINNKRC
jgi:hypothetical protein